MKHNQLWVLWISQNTTGKKDQTNKVYASHDIPNGLYLLSLSFSSSGCQWPEVQQERWQCSEPTNESHSRGCFKFYTVVLFTVTKVIVNKDSDASRCTGCSKSKSGCNLQPKKTWLWYKIHSGKIIFTQASNVACIIRTTARKNLRFVSICSRKRHDGDIRYIVSKSNLHKFLT